MNRFQIRRRVQGLLRDDTFPVEVLNEALDRVFTDISGMGRWRFQEATDSITLVTGTYQYTITSTIIAEQLVVYRLGSADNQAVLTKLPDMFNAVENGLFLNSGIPSSYARFAGQWWFDPIPSSDANGFTVSVLHYKDITLPTDDKTAITSIPARWHANVLVYGVAASVAPSLMTLAPEGLVTFQSLYRKSLNDMRQQEGWEPYTDKRLIRDERWNGFESAGNVGSVR